MERSESGGSMGRVKEGARLHLPAAERGGKKEGPVRVLGEESNWITTHGELGESEAGKESCEDTRTLRHPFPSGLLFPSVLARFTLLLYLHSKAPESCMPGQGGGGD